MYHGRCESREFTPATAAFVPTTSSHYSDSHCFIFFQESISTCKFAQRVAMIKNDALVNEEIDPKLVRFLWNGLWNNPPLTHHWYILIIDITEQPAQVQLLSQSPPPSATLGPSASFFCIIWSLVVSSNVNWPIPVKSTEYLCPMNLQTFRKQDKSFCCNWSSSRWPSCSIARLAASLRYF